MSRGKPLQGGVRARLAPGTRVVAVAAALCFDASAYRGAQAGWRSNGPARWPMDLAEDERRHAVHVTVRGPGRLHVELDGGVAHDIELGPADGADRPLSIDGVHTRVTAVAAGGSIYAEPKDYGFMYQHSFADPDGHCWELVHMSAMPSA